MTTPKFKAGDLVVTNGKGGAYKAGTYFTVKEARHLLDRGSRVYYTGDPCGIGVWEEYLDFAPGELRADRLTANGKKAQQYLAWEIERVKNG